MSDTTVAIGVDQAIYALENAVDDLSGYHHSIEGRRWLVANYKSLSHSTVTLIKLIAKLDPDAMHFTDNNGSN